MNWKDNFPKENRYFETENGILYEGDAVEQLKQIPDESIDLVITSPPYDNMRFYSATNDKELKTIWNFEKFKIIAKELYRIVKKGGIVVWIVGDATINGSETGNSFRQALYFKDKCGFNIHDTMIFEKTGFNFPSKNRYHQIFEYMFVFSKGKPKTFNPIIDRKNKWKGSWGNTMVRQKDGSLKNMGKTTLNKYGKRLNIWRIKNGKGFAHKDQLAYKHPATFPESLAKDHIISWSNENNVVLDTLCGSGTTLKMAEKLGRKWIGIEINKEYCEIAKQRILTLKKE